MAGMNRRARFMVSMAMTAFVAVTAYGQQLVDSGFEDSTPDGTFPSSGAWVRSWAPTTAGAVCASTAAHTGSSGLWGYTGREGTSTWSGPYQAVPAQSADVVSASAWVRTPPPDEGASWIEGSTASISLEFWGDAGLLSALQADPVITADSGWRQLAIEGVTPVGTTSVRFVCVVRKPTGQIGISVANFDDCSLETRHQSATPMLTLKSPVLGFGTEGQTRTLNLGNSGTAPLHWSATTAAGWLSVAPSSGVIAPQQTDQLMLTADRAGLLGTQQAILHLSSDGGDSDVTIFVTHRESQQPIRSSSAVRLDRTRLMVSKRLTDGSLDREQPYAIAGVCWSPASVGTLPDLLTRQQEFARWYEVDLPMIAAMHANTVKTYLDPGTDGKALAILDYIFECGLMAIITVDQGTADLEHAREAVTAFRDHPAVLCWLIGNEWPVNGYYGKYRSLGDAATATESIARAIKTLDSRHPVATSLGEVEMPGQPLAVTADLINRLCPDIDIWGVNSYRGPGFGGPSSGRGIFEQWGAITEKPLFLAEFGADSFHTTSCCPAVGYPDEAGQATYLRRQWAEIQLHLSAVYPTASCVGGAVFSWNDEWYKGDGDGGSPDTHDPGGFTTTWNPAAQPDIGFSNEEYYGLVTIERLPKAAYSAMEEAFAGIPVPARADSVPTGIELPSMCPRSTSFILEPSYPNPSKAYAVIGYSLGQKGQVSLTVLDLLGQPARSLVSQLQEPGPYRVSWDGTDDSGQPVAAGVYLAKLTVAGQGAAVRKLILLK